MLRCFVGDKRSNWDLALAQVEFTHTNYMNRGTKKTSFEIVIGMNPMEATKLRDLNIETKRRAKGEEFAYFMKTLH